MTAIVRVEGPGGVLGRLARSPGEPLLLCVDSRVARLHPWARGPVPGRASALHLAPAGEGAKSFGAWRACLEAFLEGGAVRGSRVVAVGGGAVGDMACLAAATLLRGVPWTAVPTTLLAMADAAVGGKGAIDVGGFKNQVGAFHPPSEVVVWPGFLGTLPDRERESGLGEVVKCCLLSPAVRALVERGAPLADTALACARYKLGVVGRDPRDRGGRMRLNLGHTLGHALESLFGLPHGTAVLWGTALMLRALGRDGALREMDAAMGALGLSLGRPPWGAGPPPVEALLRFAARDKKAGPDGVLRVVDCRGGGRAVLRRMTAGELAGRLRGAWPPGRRDGGRVRGAGGRRAPGTGAPGPGPAPPPPGPRPAPGSP